MRLPCFAIFLLASFSLFPQNTNIQQPMSVNTDGAAPDASAILDVQSTTRGMLTPRINTAERTAINSPAAGLLVFDTDTGSFWFFENNAWKEIPTTVPPAEIGIKAVPTAIPDCNPAGIVRTINLSQAGVIEPSVQLKICINMMHPRLEEVVVSLEAPDATNLNLTAHNGGTGSNYWGTCFTTEATNPFARLSLSPDWT